MNSVRGLTPSGVGSPALVCSGRTPGWNWRARGESFVAGRRRDKEMIWDELRDRSCYGQFEFLSSGDPDSRVTRHSVSI
jgi:hypothetical protein